MSEMNSEKMRRMDGNDALLGLPHPAARGSPGDAFEREPRAADHAGDCGHQPGGHNSFDE